MATFSDLAQRWDAWGIPAAIGVFAPWYEKLLAFPLISSFWQPELNTFCTVVSAIAALIAFSLFFRRPKSVLKGWLYSILALLVAAFVLCLVLKLTMGVTFFPAAHFQWVFWAVWVIVYSIVFICLSVVLVLAMLLVPTPKKQNP